MKNKKQINRVIQFSLLAVVFTIVLNFATITAFAAGSGTQEEPYQSLEDLMDYAPTLRNYMKQRKTSSDIPAVYVNFSTTLNADDTKAAIKEKVIELYDKALDYTGICDEGDYIRENMDAIYAYQFGGSYSQSGGTYNYNGQIQFTPTYISDFSQETEVNNVLTTAITNLNLNGKSEYEKVKAVHDYVVNNVSYDTTLEKHSTYNAVCERTSVCQGYASMLYNMMIRAGVDCRIIGGTADNGSGPGAHAWNIVKIDGVWYHVDSTWDDPVSVTPMLRYDYFLLSDGTIESSEYGSHTRGDGLKNENKVGIDYRHGYAFDLANPVSVIGYSNSLIGCETAINDSIVMNYVFDVPTAMFTDENAIISFKFPNDGDQYGTYSYTKKLVEGTEYEKDGKTYYKYPVIIPSPRMTDKIQVQLLSGDEKSKSQVFEVSFKDYATALLDELPSSETVKINYINAMLNYGAYSQKYFDYKTDDLANAGITDTVAGFSITDEVMSGTHGVSAYKRPFTQPAENEYVNYVGSSLVVGSNISIRHYFKIKSGNLSNYTFKIGSNVVTPKISGENIYIETEGMSPKKADNFYGNVHVLNGETEILNFGTNATGPNPGYNAYNYIYKAFTLMMDQSTSSQVIPAMQDLAKAIWLYLYAGNQLGN